MTRPPRTVEYRGETYRLIGKAPYYICDAHKPERALHRQIYLDNYGSIPGGFDVHHLDDNSYNNSPDNLGLMESGEHRSYHMQKRWKSPKFARAFKSGLTKARDAARTNTSWPEQGREAGRILKGDGMISNALALAAAVTSVGSIAVIGVTFLNALITGGRNETFAKYFWWMFLGGQALAGALALASIAS